MRLRKKHRDFCKLFFDGELEVPEIAAKLDVTERAVWYWLADADIQIELKDLEEDYRVKARRVYARHAKLAAQSKVLLLDTETIRIQGQEGEEGSEERFVYPAETVRKTIDDILSGAGVIDVVKEKDGKAEGEKTDPLSEFAKLLTQAETEDIRRLAEALRRGDSEKGTSDLASGHDRSPKRKK